MEDEQLTDDSRSSNQTQPRQPDHPPSELGVPRQKKIAKQPQCPPPSHLIGPATRLTARPPQCPPPSHLVSPVKTLQQAAKWSGPDASMEPSSISTLPPPAPADTLTAQDLTGWWRYKHGSYRLAMHDGRLVFTEGYTFDEVVQTGDWHEEHVVKNGKSLIVRLKLDKSRMVLKVHEYGSQESETFTAVREEAAEKPPVSSETPAAQSEAKGKAKPPKCKGKAPPSETSEAPSEAKEEDLDAHRESLTPQVSGARAQKERTQKTKTQVISVPAMPAVPSMPSLPKRCEELVNPRSVRFGQTTISASFRDRRGVLDSVIDDVLSSGRLPSWPAVDVVEDSGPHGERILKAFDGNRRLFISRVAWQRGVIGSMRVLICQRETARVAGKLATITDSRTSGVDVGIAATSEASASRYKNDVKAERSLQEDFDAFLKHAMLDHGSCDEQQAENAARHMASSLREKYFHNEGQATVDALHRLNPDDARCAGVPLESFRAVEAALRAPCAVRSALVAEGHWTADSGDWTIAGTHIRSPEGTTFTFEVIHTGDNVLQSLTVRARCQNTVRDGVLMQTTPQTLCWESSTPLFEGCRQPSGIWIFAKPLTANTKTSPSRRPSVVKEKTMPRPPWKRSSSMSNAEPLPSISSENTDHAPQTPPPKRSRDQYMVSHCDADNVTIVEPSEGGKILVVRCANNAEKVEPFCSASSILERCLCGEKHTELYDSGHVIDPAHGILPVAKAIDNVVSKLGGDWSHQFWRLAATTGDIHAIGVGSNKVKRERATKLALALAINAARDVKLEEVPAMGPMVARAAALMANSGR